MRIEYIREMKRSYMTVTGEGVGESYETGMLAKNQISGLLKMKIKYMDGVPVYCYDITSRQPVSRLFESRPAGENQVRSFRWAFVWYLEERKTLAASCLYSCNIL